MNVTDCPSKSTPFIDLNVLSFISTFMYFFYGSFYSFYKFLKSYSALNPFSIIQFLNYDFFGKIYFQNLYHLHTPYGYLAITVSYLGGFLRTYFLVFQGEQVSSFSLMGSLINCQQSSTLNLRGLQIILCPSSLMSFSAMSGLAMKYPVPLFLPSQSLSKMTLVIPLSSTALQALSTYYLRLQVGKLWKWILRSQDGGQLCRANRLRARAYTQCQLSWNSSSSERSRGAPNSLQNQSDSSLPWEYPY